MKSLSYNRSSSPEETIIRNSILNGHPWSSNTRIIHPPSNNAAFASQYISNVSPIRFLDTSFSCRYVFNAYNPENLSTWFKFNKNIDLFFILGNYEENLYVLQKLCQLAICLQIIHVHKWIKDSNTHIRDKKSLNNINIFLHLITYIKTRLFHITLKFQRL